MLHEVSVFAAALLVVTISFEAYAQESADRAAIRTAALDYIQGWYLGDATRMESALSSRSD